MKMRLYYVAYRYQSGLEMLAGPFGTYLEASNNRDAMTGDFSSIDPDLIIVWQELEVEQAY